MKKCIFVLSCCSSFAVYAMPEQSLRIAEAVAPPFVSVLAQNEQPIHFSEQDLHNNFSLTHQLLVYSLYGKDVDMIEKLLSIYQKFSNKDEVLILFTKAKVAFLNNQFDQSIYYYRQILAKNPELNPVRIELAIALFYDNQNSAAEDQFLKAQSEPNLPEQVNQQINAYLDALKKRNEWKFNFSTYYIRNRNVNNVSDSRQIENTGYIKNDDMLPKSANGFAINFNIGKDFNLVGKHYFVLENDLLSKIYWDNHDYDEITNRASLGYRYKTTSSTISVLPFYEKRWYGGNSYSWQNGVRLELSKWFNSNWQFSVATEQGKQRYFDFQSLNGNNKLLLSTLVWARSSKQFFYMGADFNRETTRVKQYSSDTKSLRLGWAQEWNRGISSRMAFTFSHRHYKDFAKLGGLIPLGKIRHDKIYNANLTLWKRDWHLFGITPKLQFNYRKQVSNLPTMYSYTDKNINLLFEKTF